MSIDTETLQLIFGFLVILVASDRISYLFPKIKLPLITGLLITGIITGPYILGLIPKAAQDSLLFINETALAFIAFAAGAEMYLKELRSRFKNIVWMTFGQLVVTFVLGALSIYFLADIIPFMRGINDGSKIAIALLGATIFVARSPSSAIAVINEMRAKGPFTQTSLGVTVLKDVLVIILFAVNFSLADAFITDTPFNLSLFVVLIAELVISGLLGIILSKIISFILKRKWLLQIKTILLLISGYSIYVISHFVKDNSQVYIGHDVHLEPLLICIIASFLITNYSANKAEFFNILHKTGPYIYIAFFTLTGATMSLDVLATVWPIALLLFTIRLISLVLGAIVGGTLAGDSWELNKISWMPYVTQAGVGIGLVTEIANQFPEWGNEFATLLISVIVLNQIVGPPLFKWAIVHLKEDHVKASGQLYEGVRDAIIFGLEGKSVALARLLKKHGWESKIVTTISNLDLGNSSDVDIRIVPAITKEVMHELGAEETEVIVTMLSDKENYRICEIAYEHFGTKDLIVRLNDRKNLDHFHKLGAKVVDPSTAIVSLLDQFVRSPTTTSLLLGMEEGQGTAEIEVSDPQLHGTFLRDLRLPPDTIILSIKRGSQTIISHGYTRLRLHDLVNLVGSTESLEIIRLKFEKG
jgi:Trk K+ transport system NAD-binding subunit/Kef-type K+ transport system membrane component KefB